MINFKTYKQGDSALRIAKEIESFDKNIIIAVQPADLALITRETSLTVFSQHVDPFEPGRHTGFITPRSVKKEGAKGTLLNHSEHRLDFKTLTKTIELCKKEHLKTAVFVDKLAEAKKLEKLKPTYIIYEPPELVASKTSVSQSKPELIKKFSSSLKTKFLVGAGIHSNEDVKTALSLGASGIAISSAIMKSTKPRKKLEELLKGLY